MLKKSLFSKLNFIGSKDAIELIQSHAGVDLTLNQFKDFVNVAQLDVYVETEKLCFTYQSKVISDRKNKINLDAAIGEIHKKDAEKLKVSLLYQNCGWYNSLIESDKKHFIETSSDYNLAPLEYSKVLDIDCIGSDQPSKFEDTVWLTALDKFDKEITFSKKGYQKAVDFSLVLTHGTLGFWCINELLYVNKNDEGFVWRPGLTNYGLLTPKFKFSEVIKACDELFSKSSVVEKKEFAKNIAIELIPKVIADLGYDPLAIPDPKGKPGVKKHTFIKMQELISCPSTGAELKDRLKQISSTRSQFDHYWNIARGAKVIQ